MAVVSLDALKAAYRRSNIEPKTLSAAQFDDLVDTLAASWALDITATAAEINAIADGALIVRSIPIAFDTTDIATGATLVTPAAGEVIVDYGCVVTAAWDSGDSDTLDIGITGNADALIDAADAQAAGLAAVGTDGADGKPYLFDGETAVLATVTSVGTAATAGAAVFRMVTLQY